MKIHSLKTKSSSQQEFNKVYTLYRHTHGMTFPEKFQADDKKSFWIKISGIQNKTEFTFQRLNLPSTICEYYLPRSCTTL